MKKEYLVQLDDLCSNCGFFNYETPVNNHYGCDHPECEETELVWINQPDKRPHDQRLIYKLKLASLRQRFGSYQEITSKKNEAAAKAFVKHFDTVLLEDTKFLEGFGLRKQGKCYTWTCPVAFHADLEDIQGLDPELAKEFKNDDEALNEDYMIIMNEEIQSKYDGHERL